MSSTPVDPGPAPGGGPAAAPPPARTPSAVLLPAVRRYVAAVVVAGAALVALAVWAPSPVRDGAPWWVALPVLVAGFVLADVLQLTVEVRRGTVALPLSDFPLVVALVLVPVHWAVLATALAVLARAAHLRQHATIVAFNVGSALVEVAVAYLVADRLTGPGWRLPAGIVLGLLAATVVSSAVAVGLSQAMGGRRGWRGHARVAGSYVVLGLLNPVLALAGVALVETGPVGWALLVGVVVTFVIAYRSYAVLVRDRHDLDLVHEIVAAVGTAGGDEDSAWREVAELVRQQFNAGRVVLRLPDRGGVIVAGSPLPDEVADPGAGGPPPTDAVAASVGAEPVLLRLAEVRPELRAAMGARDAAEVLLARLGDGEGGGLVELHDRQNQSQGFSAADLRLLATLVRQLGTAVDNHRLVSQLRHDAYHDRLTGLRNRLGFVQQADGALAEAGDAPVTVLVADLGAVDDVNDALGHGVGDELVVRAARRLVAELGARVGSATVAGHLGGERFAVLLVGPGPEEAEALAEDLAAALGEPYPLQGLVVEAEPVVGVAPAGGDPGDPVDVEMLVQQADVAAGESRLAGRSVRVHHPAMGQKFLRRFALVTQFRRSLESGEVEVHYQPKIDLRTRDVVGAEALMRWTHPELGPIDPGELVHVLEATGLMNALTAHVLEDAVGRCAGWARGGHPLGVAVNVSVRNLLSEDFPATVAAVLVRHDLPPARLTLEITETSVMGDAERTLPVLRALHALGVQLSVDDFGTGYSSLSYLRRLPVDEVKIDKGFVLGMDADLADHAVVRAITELGHSLGLRVVAEGVETETMRERLGALGVDAAQGFLIARAMSPARFDAWHAARVGLAAGGHDPVPGARSAPGAPRPPGPR
ncbi:putative bifunctional diguanylate cyclase/phosphodiesterase [Rhodococcus aerolatus]